MCLKKDPNQAALVYTRSPIQEALPEGRGGRHCRIGLCAWWALPRLPEGGVLDYGVASEMECGPAECQLSIVTQEVCAGHLGLGLGS